MHASLACSVIYDYPCLSQDHDRLIGVTIEAPTQSYWKLDGDGRRTLRSLFLLSPQKNRVRRRKNNESSSRKKANCLANYRIKHQSRKRACDSVLFFALPPGENCVLKFLSMHPYYFLLLNPSPPLIAKNKWASFGLHVVFCRAFRTMGTLGTKTLRNATNGEHQAVKYGVE
jgi:hypothetical protein